MVDSLVCLELATLVLRARVGSGDETLLLGGGASKELRIARNT